MSISWQPTAVEILRVMIDDLDGTLYCESKLIRILVVGAFQVVSEATFTQDFIVDVGAQSISPDPTDRENYTNDEDFVNLVCLKAACIISHGAAIKAAGNAVAGKDMNAVQFDLKGVAEHSIKLLEKGYCEKYETALNDYTFGNVTTGRAIMGPFRTYVSESGMRPYGQY